MAQHDQPAPTTRAIDALVDGGIPHQVVRTRRARDVAEAAAMRGIPVHALLKTLVVRRDEADFLFVLVPGNRNIDWNKLRAHLGIRRMSLPDAADALAVTGYERGTITPFGATTAWPVIADASIDTAGTVSIGGGAHGTSITMAAADLLHALGAEVADITKPADVES